MLVPLGEAGTVPLGQIAKVSLARGPATIRTENAQLAVYIYVDLRDRDLGGYVADAQKAVASQVKFPPGYYASWSGQFEYLERAKARLAIVVPITVLIIFLLLYLNFRRVTETLIVMLSVPFALVGGLWLMWWLGFNLSVAVAVGFIALAGVAAETGVVMLIYLDGALKELRSEREREGRAFTRDDLYAAIMTGAVERVRPKMMTVTAIMAGLLPIMWSHGTGRRGDAADRRADDRRHGLVDHAHAGRHPVDLRGRQATGRSGAPSGAFSHKSRPPGGDLMRDDMASAPKPFGFANNGCRSRRQRFPDARTNDMRRGHD